MRIASLFPKSCEGFGMGPELRGDKYSSRGPPVIEPPFEQQHHNPRCRNPPPKLQVRLSKSGRTSFRVFSKLQFSPWRRFALRGVEQIHTERELVGPGFDMINSLLLSFAENQFATTRIDLALANL